MESYLSAIEGLWAFIQGLESKEKGSDSVGEVKKASEPTQKRVILVIFDLEDENFASNFQFSIFRQQIPSLVSLSMV